MSFFFFSLFSFEKPSAIQQRAILPVISGHDVIAQAQSGTGKTATFAISILQRIDLRVKEPQALVLAPTRELAQQIQKVRKKKKKQKPKKNEAKIKMPIYNFFLKNRLPLLLEITWKLNATPQLEEQMFVKI